MSRDGSGPPRKITCDVPVQSLFRVQSNWDAWMKSGASGVSIPIHSLSSPARIAFIVLPMYTCTRNSRWNGKNEIRRGFSYIRIFVYRGKLYASIKREGGKLSVRPMIDSSHSLASKKKKRDIYFFFSLLLLLLLIPTYLRAKYIFRFHRVTIVGKLVIFRFVPVSTSFEMCWLMKKHQTSLICHPRRVKKRRKKEKSW